jgi:hypothetical protein
LSVLGIRLSGVFGLNLLKVWVKTNKLFACAALLLPNVGFAFTVFNCENEITFKKYRISVFCISSRTHSHKRINEMVDLCSKSSKQ